MQQQTVEVKNMGYRLKDDESFSHGIKRIVLEQLDEALDSLKPTVRNKDQAIHDARVNVKKVRAVLRLVRDSLGGATYEEENIFYRDVNRSLSKVRDSAAMIEIVDKLTEHFSDQLSKNAFSDVRIQLRRSKTKRTHNQNQAMTTAAGALRRARKRVRKWPKLRRSRSLALGLGRVFKKGRSHLTLAYDQPSVENFHELRKQVKHLLYETELLRSLWGKMMKAFSKELNGLGDYLSEDHDLAMLRQKVSEQSENSEDLIDIEALIALIDQRRNEIQTNAKTVAERIYAERPRAFVDRAQKYWQAWRSEVKQNSIVLA